MHITALKVKTIANYAILILVTDTDWNVRIAVRHLVVAFVVLHI